MIFEKVRAMLAEKLDCDPSEINMDTEFGDLGIDSLDVTELIMKIEDEFAIKIEIAEALAKVSELVALIESKLP